MCGLTGFWDFSSKYNTDELTNIAIKMADNIKNRGPDLQAVWVNPEKGLALAHCRLAIIDLTPTGKQPMHSSSGRFVIIYNGEVYNFSSIQKELINLGHQFKGHSDTEVILAAFEEWGIKLAVSKFIGMFAIAVWDNELEELVLIRDRLGVKPLYFGQLNNIFFFGSQLKSFFIHPSWKGTIDLQVLSKYVVLNYVPTPYSIFKDIYKLDPATILTINKQQKLVKFKYWDLGEIIANRQYIYSEQLAIEKLHNLLKDSINIRMISDVPLGAFLSGGIDSSLVVALMQANSSSKIKTFTIGFTDQNYNEANFASNVAQHLGTDHQELILDPNQALELIYELPNFYDEPFADSSQIPTLLVAKLARQKVIVSLSGDGGDELFAGYNRYYFCNNMLNKIAWMPKNLRNLLVLLIQAISIKNWNLINKLIKINQFGEKLYKLASILLFNNKIDCYNYLVSFWHNNHPMKNVANNSILNPDLVYLRERPTVNKINNIVEKMQFLDINNYLLDDILTKVDRASMAYGLEAREPLLDHRLVEFAWNLPMNFKIRGNEQKWILKQVLLKYLPRNLIDRTKMGFGLPIGSWLKTDLRSWALDLLNYSTIENQGLFDPKIIHTRLQQHLSGNKNHEFDLWGILMFQAWHAKYAKYISA